MNWMKRILCHLSGHDFPRKIDSYCRRCGLHYMDVFGR